MLNMTAKKVPLSESSYVSGDHSGIKVIPRRLRGQVSADSLSLQFSFFIRLPSRASNEATDFHGIR
jgi:hypothetical protein